MDLNRRDSTEEQKVFWGWVEPDDRQFGGTPPQVLALLDATSTPIEPERIDTVVEWARQLPGWAFKPRPLYARDDGGMVELDE